MNIMTLILLPLMAFVLYKRINQLKLATKSNQQGRVKAEMLFLSLTVVLMIGLVSLTEFVMP